MDKGSFRPLFLVTAELKIAIVLFDYVLSLNVLNCAVSGFFGNIATRIEKARLLNFVSYKSYYQENHPNYSSTANGTIAPHQHI